MMEFEMFCWKVQRELRKNRKPIILLFGNGFESQILLLVLHKLKKKFLVVHAYDDKLWDKTKNVLRHFKHEYLLLKTDRVTSENKSFCLDASSKAIFFEKMKLGFPFDKYLIVTGFKDSETSLRKALLDGFFEEMYCPLLRYPDESVQMLYQNMTDTESLGKFLWKNNLSDSHHNITIV